MKKAILFLSTLSVLVFLSRCATMNVEALQEMEEVSVAVIGVNKNINLGGFNGLSSVIQRVANDDDFNLDPILAQLHEKTFGEYEKMMPFEFVDENRVIQSERYQNFQLFEREKNEERFEKLSYIKTPEGYKNYNPMALNAKKKAKILRALPEGSDGAMFIYVDYHLKRHDVPMVPVSKAGVEARIILEVVDQQGEKVMKIEKKAESEEKIKAVAGIMTDVGKIQSMCRASTEMAIEKVDAFIQEEMSGV